MTRGGDEAVDAAARAGHLIDLFCGHRAAFGVVEEVGAEDVPQPDRQLLDHRSHMTVTMERYHGCTVALRVVAERACGGSASEWYAREILLVRPDGVVVQYGIVRTNLAALDPAVAAAIRSHAAPLGRILVATGRLCEVQRVSLVRIEPGSHLQRLVGDAAPLHGRVAEIEVDGAPTIQLLEVVVPPGSPRPVSPD